MQVPADWSVKNEAQGVAASPPPKKGQRTVPGALSFESGPEPLGTTEDDAKDALDGARSSGAKNVKRLPNVKINGMTLYHIQYEVKGSMWDGYGTVVNGNGIGVEWQLFKGGADGYTRAQADKLIQPVMATLKATS